MTKHGVRIISNCICPVYKEGTQVSIGQHVSPKPDLLPYTVANKASVFLQWPNFAWPKGSEICQNVLDLFMARRAIYDPMYRLRQSTNNNPAFSHITWLTNDKLTSLGRLGPQASHKT